MSRTAAPGFVLRAVWTGRDIWRRQLTGPEAQALEYADLMGEDALDRNWLGSDRSRSVVRRRLFEHRARAERASS